MKNASAYPSLAALRAFEATAQLLSFRAAAQALIMTQSAVSHHIAQLETLLGGALFVRGHRSIVLTPMGVDYLARIAPSLAQIFDATQALRRKHSGAAPLRVALLPSFAANWLVPRLPHFRAEHPSVSLELIPSLALADVATGEVDLAIRYGDGRWPELHCTHLMCESLTPVASPDFIARNPCNSPAEMLRLPLLLNLRPFDWQLWAKSAGLENAQISGLQLTDYNIVLQAALEGQGVLMGRLQMLASKLASGALVALFPNQVLRDRTASYWLLSRKKPPISEAQRAFSVWLVQQCRANSE